MKEEAIKLIKERFSSHDEQNYLLNFINSNDIVASSLLEVFENSRDVEDFIDSLQRILNKGKPKPKEDNFLPKKQNLNIPNNTEKNQEKLSKQKQDSPQQPSSNSTPRINFTLENFLKINEEKFQNEEYGMILNMHKTEDNDLKGIIFQCQNIKNQEVQYLKIKKIIKFFSLF